jgi:small multidrug resistance pump
MQWLYLSIAIASEVVGTTCLKLSDGFTKLWPSVGVVAAYSVTFVFLALTLKTLPVGIALIVLGVVVLNGFSKSIAH